jgi:subtilisin family serine protease/subtilisin-like proprotein convertase family protein
VGWETLIGAKTKPMRGALTVLLLGSLVGCGPRPLGRPAPDASGDPYFEEQWHLNSAEPEHLNAGLVWNTGLRGEGVTLIVVDDGVELEHEDLAENASAAASHDYLEGSDLLPRGRHGTAVAGLAAARDHNARGGRGVAPRATVASYNVVQHLTSTNIFDAMTRAAETVEVSNNSWGESRDGTGLLERPDTQWTTGVALGALVGRGGLGTVYVWAGGNGGASANRDNSNYDGQANSRFVLAVGSIADDGRKTATSEEGANLVVVTPAGDAPGRRLLTTDLSDAFGFNDGQTTAEFRDANYTQLMGGTSASAPLVSGVVALMLQARPELGVRDVRRVLAQSARRNDSADLDWSRNGAGHFVNHKYGFGAVDAVRAVELARRIELVGEERTISMHSTARPMTIPDNADAGVVSEILVTEASVNSVEFAEVEVEVSHDRVADLEIVLRKEGGAFDVLHETHTCATDVVTSEEVCASLRGHVFGTVRHLDEPAAGRWTLEVRDLRAGRQGTFTSWTLTVWGSP